MTKLNNQYEKYVIKKIISIAERTPYSIKEILNLTESLCNIASNRSTNLLTELEILLKEAKNGK